MKPLELVPGLGLLAQAKTKDEIGAAIDVAARSIGFVTWSTMFVRDTADGPVFTTIQKNPAGYDSIYYDPVIFRTDPVMQTLKTSNLPVVWDQSFYVSRGQGEHYEEMSGFGMKRGISAALHMPGGKHCVVGFDGPDGTEAMSPKLLASSLGQLQLVLVHTEAAFRPLALAQFDDSDHHEALTPRERECLIWSAAGKTAWEIGQILALSEKTVGKYLDQVNRKLQCVTKAQAVAKAIRLGIIT